MAIPAPVDEKMLFVLFVFTTLNRHKEETFEFYKEVKDEIKDRVKRGIAALETERCRVIGDIPAPWFSWDIFRKMGEYGCVQVGSTYVFSLFGMWEIIGDGILKPKTTPEQQGLSMRTRDDVLKVMADWHLGGLFCQNIYSATQKAEFIKKLVKQWKCDWVHLHYDRHCEQGSLSLPRVKLELRKVGIPVLSYEGNLVIKADFDPKRTNKIIEDFLENLELRKLG